MSIQAIDGIYEREIIHAAILSTFVKVVAGFTEMDIGMELKRDEKFTMINMKVKCKILKKVFEHEIPEIEQRINNQNIRIKEREVDRTLETHSPIENITATHQIPLWHPLSNNIDDLYTAHGINVDDLTFSEFCDDVEIVVDRLGYPHNTVMFNCKTNLLKQTGTSISPSFVLTYSLCSVSSVSLVAMIIINRYDGSHREVAASNLENLGLSLILSNLSLMVGNFAPMVSSLACFVVSILSHYLWLTVFSFACLAVIYIIVTLNKMTRSRLENDELKARKRLVITVVGLIIPLFVVGPALILDQFGPPHYSPGYGYNDVCFPVRFPGNLIFFTGPVLVSVLANAIFLIHVVVKIKRSTLTKANLQQSSVFFQAKVFLRILSISGCFWITGVLASIIESEWLEYVFIITCGSHGLFIALANLTTRRVRCCEVSIVTNRSVTNRSVSKN